jgi:hypothetical protein
MTEDVYTGGIVRTRTRRPSRRLGGKRRRIQLSLLPDALKIARNTACGPNVGVGGGDTETET